MFETNKTDLAYEQIKERVVNLRVRPGDQLHITELSESLSISVTPVREALTRLHSEGLVVLVPNRGFFTRTIDVDELRDLYELAFVVLKHAIKHSIENGDDSVRALIPSEQFQFNHSGTALNGSALDAQNQSYASRIERLYEEIAMLSGNATMIDTIRAFNDKTHFIRVADLSFEEHAKMIAGDMADLVTHLSAGQATDAIANLRRQLSAKLSRMPFLAKECLAQIFLASGSRDYSRQNGRGRASFA